MLRYGPLTTANKMVLNFIFRWCVCFILSFTPGSVSSHGEDPHIQEVNQKSFAQGNGQRIFKTGNIFEVVIHLRTTPKSEIVIMVCDALSNIPTRGALINLSIARSSDIYESLKIEESKNAGIYRADILPKGVSKIRLNVQEGSKVEEFLFDVPMLSNNDSNSTWWPFYGAILGVALFLVTLIIRHFYHRNPRIYQMILIYYVLLPYPTFGHGEGDASHDHEITPMTAIHNNIIVPKEIQFHLGITTEKVTTKPLKGSIRLMGKVISDPSGYVRLHVSQTSRIINHSSYPLPLPGQKVKVDEVILAVAPTLTKVETGDQRSALYKAESEITQFRKEVDRLEKLGSFAIQKNLDNARAELEKAIKQRDEILNQTFKPEILRSPINGVIADFHVRPGEIVTPDQTVVEIIDPDKFLIEAQVFNPPIAPLINRGYARHPLYPQNLLPLKVLGISPKVNAEDQSIHILFQPEGKSEEIKLDMAIEILGELNQTESHLVIPRKSLVEDSSGSWVFIHTNPETFEARKVKVRRTIDDFVEVEEGLEEGEKIVTHGAYLLNEAR